MFAYDINGNQIPPGKFKIRIGAWYIFNLPAFKLIGFEKFNGAFFYIFIDEIDKNNFINTNFKKHSDLKVIHEIEKELFNVKNFGDKWTEHFIEIDHPPIQVMEEFIKLAK